MALSELPPGSKKELSLDDDQVLFIRCGEKVFASAAHCPHKGMALELGEMEEGCRITCPLHAATFDLETGRPNEESSWAGHLPTYPTRIRDGMIEVQLP